MADEDGDGVPEEVYVAGSPPEQRIVKVTNVSGHIVWVAGPESTGGDYLGPLVPCGDVDGDGVEDFGVGNALWWNGLVSPEAIRGRVLMLSGRTGRVVWEVRGERGWKSFGWAMARFPDCDQDGIAEIISSFVDTSVEDAARLAWRGGIEFLSGANGKRLGVSGPLDDMVTGCSVSTVGSDGLGNTRDIAVGTFCATALGEAGVPLEEAGRVVVLSDLGQKQRASRSGDTHHGEFGAFVLGIRDVNGDGWGDLLIGACGEAQGRGCVHVVSGSDLKDIAMLVGPEGCTGFGGAMWRVPNADGRGHDGVEVTYRSQERDSKGWRGERLRILAIQSWEVLSDFRLEPRMENGGAEPDSEGNGGDVNK